MTAAAFGYARFFLFELKYPFLSATERFQLQKLYSEVFGYEKQDGYLSFDPHVEGGLFPLRSISNCLIVSKLFASSSVAPPSLTSSLMTAAIEKSYLLLWKNYVLYLINLNANWQAIRKHSTMTTGFRCSSFVTKTT